MITKFTDKKKQKYKLIKQPQTPDTTLCGGCIACGNLNLCKLLPPCIADDEDPFIWVKIHAIKTPRPKA